MYCFATEPFSAKTPEEIHRIRLNLDSYYASCATFPYSAPYQVCAPAPVIPVQPISSSSPIMPIFAQPQPQSQPESQSQPPVAISTNIPAPVPPMPKSPPKQALPAPKETKNNPAQKRTSTPARQRTPTNAKSPARVLSSSSPRAASAPPKSKRNPALAFAESSATALPPDISLPPVPGSPGELQATPLKGSSPSVSQRAAATSKPPSPFFDLDASAGRSCTLPPIPTTNCVMA